MPVDWLTILLTARRQTRPCTDEWQYLTDAVSHVLQRNAARAWRATAVYPFFESKVFESKEETR